MTLDEIKSEIRHKLDRIGGYRDKRLDRCVCKERLALARALRALGDYDKAREETSRAYAKTLRL